MKLCLPPRINVTVCIASYTFDNPAFKAVWPKSLACVYTCSADKVDHNSDYDDPPEFVCKEITPKTFLKLGNMPAV